MFKKGDKVEIIGREYTGPKGTVRRKCKISKSGEPQESGCAVKLSHDTQIS
jgi:hypothetical protein